MHETLHSGLLGTLAEPQTAYSHSRLMDLIFYIHGDEIRRRMAKGMTELTIEFKNGRHLDINLERKYLMPCKIFGNQGGGTEAEALAAGQFFEVTCEGMEKGRTIVGWTGQADGGALVRMVNCHPTWADPQIRDIREPRMCKCNHLASCHFEFGCACEIGRDQECPCDAFELKR